MRALTARYWERRNRRSATSPRDSELQGPNSSQTLSPWLLLLLPLVLPNSRFLAIVFWDFKFQAKLFIWYYSISYSFNTGNSKTLEFRILLIMKNKNPRFENLKGPFLAFPPRILNTVKFWNRVMVMGRSLLRNGRLGFDFEELYLEMKNAI